MQNKNLGLLTTQLSQIANQQGHYGYRKALAVARAAGFRTLAHAINAVASRSSEKVVRNLNLNSLIIH